MSFILAGDVGATKVLLQAYHQGEQRLLAEKRYLSADFFSLTLLVQHFQNEFDLPYFSAACFGVPGPVVGRQVQLTNLPWVIRADELTHACQIEHVEIINDFYAAALGIDELTESDLICLQDGQYETSGNRLVVGAGSGLGVAPVKNCQGTFLPQASEGGHMDFAPLNGHQINILTWLQQKWPHVSYERLLSGEGLETLYFFYNIQSHGHGKKSVTAAQIYQEAINGEKIACQTLDTFVQIYGAFTGNAALIWEAQAGIFIAGGIAPKIKDWLLKPLFMEAFLSKGRMRKVVETFPVYLVMNEKVGLFGAMRRAQAINGEQ
ncbi:Glucokinase [Hydrogenovibrio crunogenus]|uniref:Glucokinase n=1 Tax=Hydrogenovibrio crunogenus TaxID=39765 RepID=A0A4P7NY27_9GAMM|nr:glucokinase [Hydrogenovibrio crunogenus]QBZ82508.1 Glucokinase [Hydrogenovibrio crunogenus]RUM92788.1 MAG: glucokinase [Thiomicrospira sp.]